MAKKKDKKKIKIPKSVLDLRLSPKKFAKKHGIKLKGKGLSKGEKKRNRQRFRDQYCESSISGLNKAVKILSEVDPDSKKFQKVKDGVENIILNPEVMKRIAKLYSKDPERYPNMMFLPRMIMITLVHYQRDDINDEEKELGKNLDSEKLIAFCSKVLKKEIKRYEKLGLSDDMAFQLATVVPTTKIFKDNKAWYQKLIQVLYQIAESEEVDIKTVLPAVQKIDKKNKLDKKEFLEGFFTEFIWTRSSNKNHSFNDSQKELHENLIEASLEYLESLKARKLKEVLKSYIKRRKRAESFKTDGKRVIKFVDHANSNSSYTNIKTVVQELISDNSSNELYLS